MRSIKDILVAESYEEAKNKFFKAFNEFLQDDGEDYDNKLIDILDFLTDDGDDDYSVDLLKKFIKRY